MTSTGSRDFQLFLQPSVGYGVVIGLGAFFAVLMGEWLTNGYSPRS
jgi:hypothetical protein